MLFLADAIRTGSRYRMNLDKAEGWYRHAASLGSGRAMYGLGLVHLSRGEDAKAIQAFEVGVERNCGAAMWVLGRMYREGRGVEPDLARAFSLWARGRSVGHIWSSRDLSRLQIDGGLGTVERMRGYLAFLADLAALPLAMLGRKTDRLMR
jgi:TPR repeat protein